MCDGQQCFFDLVEFGVGEAAEVGALVVEAGFLDQGECFAEEWFGVAGVVVEWVDQSLSAAVGAVGVGLVAGPAELGTVGAVAMVVCECAFEFGEACVDVCHGVGGWSAWRSSRRVVSSRSSA